MMNLMKLLSNPAFSKALQNITIKNNEIIINTDLTIRVNGKIKIMADDDIIVSGERLHLCPDFDADGNPVVEDTNVSFDYEDDVNDGHIVREFESKPYRRKCKCDICKE